MQAPHQLAQKLTTSGLPAAMSEMETAPPDARGSTLQAPGTVWPTSMIDLAGPQSREAAVRRGELLCGRKTIARAPAARPAITTRTFFTAPNCASGRAGQAGRRGAATPPSPEPGRRPRAG